MENQKNYTLSIQTFKKKKDIEQFKMYPIE